MRLLLTICLMGFGAIAFGQATSSNDDMKNWLMQNFNLQVPDTMIFETPIDTKNFQQELPSVVREELKKDEWQGEFKVVEIETVEDGLTIILDDEYSFRMILMENFFLISMHGIIGDYKQTILYDFETKDMYILASYYALRPIGRNEISVSVDYYDSLDFEDPDYEGHIFERGIVDLKTGIYTLLEKE